MVIFSPLQGCGALWFPPTPALSVQVVSPPDFIFSAETCCSCNTSAASHCDGCQLRGPAWGQIPSTGESCMSLVCPHPITWPQCALQPCPCWLIGDICHHPVGGFIFKDCFWTSWLQGKPWHHPQLWSLWMGKKRKKKKKLNPQEQQAKPPSYTLPLHANIHSTRILPSYGSSSRSIPEWEKTLLVPLPPPKIK